jgi:hypothetical protein
LVLTDRGLESPTLFRAITALGWHPLMRVPAWYAWRMWIEQGFEVIKSGQWQWQYTRMTEAARAERLWAVLALATLWMMEVGGEGEALTLPALPRSVRLVRAGLPRLALALPRQEALPPG